MSDDKQPMQAGGDGHAAAEDAPGKDDAGESGGGAYPNPHTGKTPGGFEGGQSGKAYHGGGQLGDETVGENGNAPTRGE